MKARTPLAGAIAGVAAGVAIVLVLAYFAASARQQDANAQTLQLIKDCTIEPAGKCAELQRKQSKAFARMIALANVCTDKPGHQTVAQVERCIRKGMEDE
jgi:hypothetical protein